MVRRTLDELGRIRRGFANSSNRLRLVTEEALTAFPQISLGRVRSLNGSPTIQEIAARWPEFVGKLSPSQREAMLRHRKEVAPYLDLL